MMLPTTKAIIRLGSIKIPSIAIGTWSWGDKETWDNVNEDSERKIEEVFEKLLNESESIFLDTAEVYGWGESEKIIGRLLKKYKEHPNINKVIIASKFLPLPWKWQYPSCLIDALKGSLDKLGLESLDLYQIHGPIHLRSIETVASGLAEAYKLGLVRAVGVSNYSLNETKRMHEALSKYGLKLASNQVEFSLLRRYPETSGLLDYCQQNDIRILAYSPLGMGRLTGKYSIDNPPPSGRNFSNYSMEKITPLLEIMKTISEERKVSIPAVALNYIMVKGGIPLAGVKNLKQLESNLQALNWKLNNEEISKLEEHAITGDWGYIWQHG